MVRRMIVAVSVDVDVDDLTEEQIERLKHHADISRRVYEASIASMAKGVRKYGPEPSRMSMPLDRYSKQFEILGNHWFPHIFSEAVDCANQTGLFADALGVDVLPEGNDG